MSDELHRLNYKIRQQKKVLRLQIRALNNCVKRGKTQILRHYAGRVRMEQKDIDFIRAMDGILEQRRAALAALCELTTEKKVYACNMCNSTGQERIKPVPGGKLSGFRNCQTCNKNGRRKPKPGCKPYL